MPYKAKNFQIIHLEIDYASVTPFGYVIHQLASKLAHLSSVSDHTLEFRTQPVKEEKESVQKKVDFHLIVICPDLLDTKIEPKMYEIDLNFARMSIYI